MMMMVLTHERDGQGDYCVHEDPQLQLLVPAVSVQCFLCDRVTGQCPPIGCEPLQDCVLIEEVVPVNAGELPSEVDLAEFRVKPGAKDKDSPGRASC